MNIKVLAFFLLISWALVTSSYADSNERKVERSEAPLSTVVNQVITADSKERKIEWSEVPLIVQQIFTKHTQGGEILKIKKEKIILMTENKQENKTTLYLAKVKKANGKKFWITTDQSGQLVDIEDEETEKVLEDEVGKKNKKNKKDN